MSELALAAVLAITILIASTISVEVGLSVALIELAAGVVIGNVFTVSVPDWLSFIGSFAGVVLTFLAGAEVDVPQFRREWRASIAIGAVSFAAPFALAMASAYWIVGWSREQAEIGGLALSTTSLAVVYAVLVESGLNRSIIGKRIMSATFVTDILTVIGLSVLFAKPSLWIVPFTVVSVLVIWTITSLYGLQSGIIDQTQFSLLITVVVLSAIVPTAIAQRYFAPRGAEQAAVDPRGERSVADGRTAAAGEVV